MGRSKKKKERPHRKFHAQSQKPKAAKNVPSKKVKLGDFKSNVPAIVPFSSQHRILLVGEGDFSFSRSLATEYACTSLYATCFDSCSALLSKYPQASSNIKTLEVSGCTVKYGIDATKLGMGGGVGGGKRIRAGGWDRIVFNFPHVGGLTKDVNRQVRANQELLVSFFQRAITLLSSQGRIVVTIFEGEPYELWNVRNLARHVGLQVERSFRFDAGVYPGYKHARTLGNIEGAGGWKGEDREARTYVLAAKHSQETPSQGQRAQDDTDSESD